MKRDVIRPTMSRRVWVQFSLRGLLLFCLAVSLVFASAAWDLQRHRRQAQNEEPLKQRIRQLGGTYVTTPCGPKWLSLIPEIIRPEEPKRITRVDLRFTSRDPSFPASVMQILPELQCLKTVTISDDETCLMERPPRSDWYLLDIRALHKLLPDVNVHGILID